MLSTERETVISPAPLAGPRLLLQQDDAGPAPLDGGWWPRSADPAVELPGLVLDLDKRHGRITRVLLGATDWNTSRPSRLQVRGPTGTRTVRLGWFASMPAGLLTAISASDQRTDLVTIPAGTSEQDAADAMEQAAHAGNREHAPAILAAINAADRPTDGAAVGKRSPAAAPGSSLVGDAIGPRGAIPPADRTTIIDIGGVLDRAAVSVLRERLIGVLHRGTILLVLDLSRVLSCDVSGLAMLVGTQHRARRLGSVVQLADPSPPVAKLLRSTGLDRSFICRDLPAAPVVKRTLA